MVDKLSPAKVAALAKAGKPGLYGDGNGLALRVARGGSASWVLRYERAGKGHEKGLGSLRLVGLAEARGKALEYQKALHGGVDLLAREKASPQPITFSQESEKYIGVRADAWKGVRTRKLRQQWLDDYILPEIGGLDVATIAVADVLRVLTPIWGTKVEAARKIRELIEAVLDHAIAREVRIAENPARWRYLSKLLQSPSRIKATLNAKAGRDGHHAALPWQDVPAFMAGLAARGGMAAKALRFLILTAARSGEVRGMRWAEVDLAGKVWAIPGSRMKAGQPHRVALSTTALEILLGVLPDEVKPEALVFPGQRDGKTLSDVALSKLLPSDATVHGFRSTFRTWAGECTQHAREVIEQALAHKLGDSVEQAYARGDLFQRRVRLMADWADHCAGKAVAGDVVQLRA